MNRQLPWVLWSPGCRSCLSMISVISFTHSVWWYIHMCCRDIRFFVIVTVADHTTQFEFDVFELWGVSCYFVFVLFCCCHCIFLLCHCVWAVIKRWLYFVSSWVSHQCSTSWCDEACAGVSLLICIRLHFRFDYLSFVLSFARISDGGDCVIVFGNLIIILWLKRAVAGTIPVDECGVAW